MRRVDLARRRLENILRDRILATEKQLESKISEAGPENQRCDPHVLSQALRELVKEQRISSLTGPRDSKFFYLKSIYDPHNPKHNERKEYLFSLYNQYREAAQHQPHCGEILEQIIWNSVNASELYNPIGSLRHPVKDFGELTLPGELDLILLEKNRMNSAVVIEAKNIREWIYPTSAELWQLISNAVAFADTGMDTLPVLVSRKIQYATRLLFKRIGILGLSTHSQFFAEDLADKLLEVQNKDGLGFHDIAFGYKKLPWLDNFLNSTIPKEGPKAQQVFSEQKELLREFAPKFLSKRANKFQIWTELAQELGMSHDYDDYDY